MALVKVDADVLTELNEKYRATAIDLRKQNQDACKCVMDLKLHNSRNSSVKTLPQRSSDLNKRAFDRSEQLEADAVELAETAKFVRLQNAPSDFGSKGFFATVKGLFQSTFTAFTSTWGDKTPERSEFKEPTFLDPFNIKLKTVKPEGWKIGNSLTDYIDKLFKVLDPPEKAKENKQKGWFKNLLTDTWKNGFTFFDTKGKWDAALASFEYKGATPLDGYWKQRPVIEFLKAEGETSAKFGFGGKGLTADLKAAGSLNLVAAEAEALRKFAYESSVSGKVEAAVGVNGEGTLKGNISLTQLDLAAGLEAKAGASAKATGAVEFLGIKITLEGEGIAGAAAIGKAELALGKQSHLKLKLGAAVGLGLSGGVAVDVDTDKLVKGGIELAREVPKLYDSASKLVTETTDSISKGISKQVTEISKGFSDAFTPRFEDGRFIPPTLFGPPRPPGPGR
jgi:hypothetical protein